MEKKKGGAQNKQIQTGASFFYFYLLSSLSLIKLTVYFGRGVEIDDSCKRRKTPMQVVSYI